jgi:hypothetical protein
MATSIAKTPFSFSPSSSRTLAQTVFQSGDFLRSISQFFEPEEVACSLRVCRIWKNALDIELVWNGQAERVRARFPRQAQKILREYQSDDVEGQFDSQLLRIISELYGVRIISELYGDRTGTAKEQFLNPNPAIAFGREEWLKYLRLDPGKAPPLPSNIYALLQKPSRFWPNKTVEESCSLLLIPKTIRISESIINFLKMMGGTVPVTLRTVHMFLGDFGVSSSVLEEHGNNPVEESNWILITNNIVPGSDNFSYINQRDCLETEGYEVPNVLDVTIAVLSEYSRSRKRLFRGHIYTRCREVFESHQLVAGGFSSRLYVGDDDDFDDGIYGVAAVQRFPKGSQKRKAPGVHQDCGSSPLKKSKQTHNV